MSNWDAFVDWADAVGRDPARRKKVAWSLVAAGVVVLAAFHASIYNTFLGPFPIDESDLFALKAAPFKRYVTVQRAGKTVQYGELRDAGVYEETYHRGGYSTYAGSYHWLESDGRQLLVHSVPGSISRDVVGVLKAVENPGGRLSLGRAAPLMVDGDFGAQTWALIAALVGAGCLVVGLDQLRRALRKPVTYSV